MKEELATMRANGKQMAGQVHLLPKEKKLRTFSGVAGTDIASFVEDVRAAD